MQTVERSHCLNLSLKMHVRKFETKHWRFYIGYRPTVADFTKRIRK